MALSFKFYTDAALTTLAGTYAISHLVDGSTDPQDFVFYLGSTNASNKAEALSDPGVDQITVSLSAVNSDWAASTAYSASDRVVPTSANGYKYEAQGAGTSDSGEPTWPTTIGDTVVDNGVTWENVGEVHVSTEFKLALSSGGLASAVAGDPLDIGTSVTGGANLGTAIYVRVDDSTASVNSGADIKMVSESIIETAI